MRKDKNSINNNNSKNIWVKIFYWVLENKREKVKFRAYYFCFVILEICKSWIFEIKMYLCFWCLPDSYATNLDRCVSPDKWKISRLKSHNYHIFLQKLLPIGIHGKLTSNVRVVITKLYMLFKNLCTLVVNQDVLQKMKDDIAIIC